MKRVTANDVAAWRKMFAAGMSKSEIARRSGAGLRTVRRFLNKPDQELPVEGRPHDESKQTPNREVDQDKAETPNRNGEGPQRICPGTTAEEEAVITRLHLDGKEPEQIVAEGHGIDHVRETLGKLAELNGLTDKSLYDQLAEHDAIVTELIKQLATLKSELANLKATALTPELVSSCTCPVCKQKGLLRVVVACENNTIDPSTHVATPCKFNGRWPNITPS